MVVRRLMPFTALKLGTIGPEDVINSVVRRLMPFTALKRCVGVSDITIEPLVVRRLMPFTALKQHPLCPHRRQLRSCAPPNAVYGIETF